MMFNICKVKNIDTVENSYQGNILVVDQEFIIPDNTRSSWASDVDVLIDIANGKLQVGDDTNYIVDINDQIDWLKSNNTQNVKVEEQAEAQPFALPVYRTKNDATDELVSIEPNNVGILDFKMVEERYVSGGEMLCPNAKFGDYITASVYDKDGVIPEAYRAVLCENWPIVVEYVHKQWIIPVMGSKIDTRPLNAKITSNLYLRINYHACDEGETRKAAINYNLTQKL